MTKTIFLISFLIIGIFLSGCSKLQNTNNQQSDNTEKSEQILLSSKYYINQKYNYKASFSDDWKEVVGLHDGTLGPINFQGDYIVLENKKNDLGLLFWYYDAENTSISEIDKNNLINWYINAHWKNEFDKYDYKTTDIKISDFLGKEVYIPDWSRENTVPNKYNFLIQTDIGLLAITANKKSVEINNIINSIKFIKK